MNTRFLKTLTLSSVLAFSALVSAQQGHNPPPPPPNGGGGQQPGGYNPGSSGNQSSNNTSRSNAQASSATSSARSAYQLGPVGRWWDDKSTAQAVGLTKMQQQRMDAIFNSSKSSILDSYKSFLSEQAKLAQLNKNPNADQASIFAAIDSVSKARTNLQKATAQVMLQIRQVMDAQQLAKLEKLY